MELLQRAPTRWSRLPARSAALTGMARVWTLVEDRDESMSAPYRTFGLPEHERAGRGSLRPTHVVHAAEVRQATLDLCAKLRAEPASDQFVAPL